MKPLFTIILAALITPVLHAKTPSSAARAQAAVGWAYQVIVSRQPTIDPPAPSAPEATPVGRPFTHRRAYEAYTKQRRSMVVMVTADWCPYCPVVKASLEAMLRDGQLAEASLVVLDYDSDAKLARQVLGTRRQLPFVALFTHDDRGPRAYRGLSTSQIPGLLTQ